MTTEPLTDKEIEVLRETAAKATPGLWAVPVANVFRVIAPETPHNNPKKGAAPPYPWRIVADMGDEDTGAHDARHIAAWSPENVLRVLDELEALRRG